MADSYVAYTGDASTTAFTFAKPYISQDHVEVTIDGVAQTDGVDYNWTSSTEITFTTAPASGARIVFQRNTSRSTRIVDYVTGNLPEEDLDNDSLQAFYMGQEAIDIANDAITLDQADNKYDADSKVIKNVANATASTEAVNKSQLDAVSAAAGNVPTPGDPGEDGYFLKAGSGLWTWQQLVMADVSDISTYAKTILDDTSASAARTTLGAFATAGGALTGELAQAIGTPKASASTLALDGDGNIYAVSGTATITTVTGVAAGGVYYLIATGAWSITDDGDNIIIDPTTGGGNYGMGSGQCSIWYAHANNKLTFLGGHTLFASSATVAAATNNVLAVTPGRMYSHPGVGWTLGTEQSLSGTSVDFTSIPSGTAAIMLTWEGLSTSGTSTPLIQLGDAGGIETSSYVSTSSRGTSTIATSSSTAGMLLNSVTAGNTHHGHMLLVKSDDANNTWIQHFVGSRGDAAAFLFGAGSKSLSAELDRLRITTANGTDTFDAGSANILYMGGS